jgi:hypothetical protein
VNVNANSDNEENTAAATDDDDDDDNNDNDKSNNTNHSNICNSVQFLIYLHVGQQPIRQVQKLN